MVLLVTVSDAHWNGMKVVLNSTWSPTKGIESSRLAVSSGENGNPGAGQDPRRTRGNHLQPAVLLGFSTVPPRLGEPEVVPAASGRAKRQDRTAIYSPISFSSGFPSAVGSSMPRIRAIVGAMLRLLTLPSSVPGLTPAPQTTQVASSAG